MEEKRVESHYYLPCDVSHVGHKLATIFPVTVPATVKMLFICLCGLSTRSHMLGSFRRF